MRINRLLLALVAATLAATPIAAKPFTPIPAPRPLSSAEEAGSQTVVHYLGGGAAAVFDDLSSSSPLRSLSRADALNEIEARLGPTRGAKWHLDTAMPSLAEHAAVFSVGYPSGADETIRFDFERERDVWRLSSIRTTAEPVTQPVLLQPAAKDEARHDEEPVDDRSDQRVALSLALPALAFCVGAAAFGGKRPILARVVLVAAAAAVTAGTAYVVKPALARTGVRSVAVVKSATPPPFVRLGLLLPLRKALAAGDAAPVPTIPLQTGPTRDVADLWTAQLLLQQDRITDARKLLRRFPRRSNIPLAELLRARIALKQMNDVDAVISFERAIDLGPGRDTLWIEAAEALSILGFEDRGERYLRRAADVGSREPGVFYGMSVLSVMDRDRIRAGLFLTSAWQMQPRERAELFRIPPLWYVLKGSDMQKLIQPHVAAEPAFASEPSVRPMNVAPGAQSTVMGNYLRVVIGPGELDLPGGARIAPADARVIDAGSWRRDQEQIALADFEALRREIHSAGELLQPSLRTRCLNTAASLAERNRWNDVLTLTDSFSPKDERVPVALTLLRGAALSRLGRADALRQLIVDLLHSPALKRKSDPTALAVIAELLAAVDEYDGAIGLLERARRDLELPGLSERIEQLTLERKLASSYASFASEHFEIRYGPDTPQDRVSKIATILEAELRRLQASWFPTGLSKRTIVDVLSWEDFRNYTGSESIEGLFTNKIMLPLGNVPRFPPEIVAIMTHELAHALIAEASNNLAPRWFHEAFATRLEMNEESQNAFQFYRDERFLTVALLDAVADGSPDPDLVVESYQIGATTLRFIESKYGKAGIAKMVAAFRTGATTEEAVHAVTGGSVTDLDRLARAWGASQPALFTARVVQYDEPLKPRGATPKWGDD